MKFATKLRKYIENNSLKKYLLAESFGVSPAIISRYLHEGVVPSYPTAKRINRVTDNFITMSEMGYD